MNDINELFRIVKEQLDIKSIAKDYGMNLDRNNKSLCPFHNDTHPSLNFKNNYFKCFACGESGDIFKLVGKLTGIIKPVDVLKVLNDNYSLNLPINNKLSEEDKKVLKNQKHERQHYLDLRNKFSDWCNYAFKTVSDYTKFLREWREIYKPSNFDDELHPLFIESLQKLDLYEYIVEMLICADKKQFQKFYIDYGKEVSKIEYRLNEYREKIS